MIRIAHPTPSPGRITAFGIEFIDGTAIVDELHPERELALVQHSFAVVTEIEAVPLDDLTVPELRQIADNKGIDLPAKAKKQEIIDTIDGHPNVPVLTNQAAEDAELTTVELPDGTVGQIDSTTTVAVSDTTEG